MIAVESLKVCVRSLENVADVATGGRVEQHVPGCLAGVAELSDLTVLMIETGNISWEPKTRLPLLCWAARLKQYCFPLAQRPVLFRVVEARVNYCTYSCSDKIITVNLAKGMCMIRAKSAACVSMQLYIWYRM